MSMNLSVYNESDPHWRGFHDVYTPKLQRFEPQGPCGMEYIENIDVVTTWKGLSSSEIAEELLFWENAFQNAICSTVEQFLVEKIKSIGIELIFDNKSTLPPRETEWVVSYLSEWRKGRLIPCKPQDLVNEMLLEHQCSGLLCPWLVNLGEEEASIALENFIHTHTCFHRIPSKEGILVHFTSQAVNGHLQVFATIESRPHILRLDQCTSPARIAFDKAVLQSASPLYYTKVEVSPDFYRQNMYHCSVRTHFPGGILFERLFRFIGYLFPAPNPPDWLVQGRRTAEELMEDLIRVEGRPIKLREVSINSTRVQEAGIEPANPPTYEDDIFVGKSTTNTDVFDEISGQKQGQTTTNDPPKSIVDEYMVNTAQNEEEDDEDMSFVGPNSPEIILSRMEELQEEYKRLEIQLKASLDPATSESSEIVSDGSVFCT